MAKTPTEPFYVYRILGEMGETVYIGKGCGRRLHNQKRRFMSGGEVLELCSTDKQAFRRERDLIVQYNPPLNKSTGGNGATRGMKVCGLPPLYASLARLIRRLDGLETSVREYLVEMINDVANRQGLAKFAAGLRPYGIEVVDG
jgi:hypothetical protein